MLIEPVCFVHAANPRLGQQLRGVGPIPDELRPLVQTATLTAFDRIVEAALQHEVDFVLLTGVWGDDPEPSLTSQIAWLRGLARLSDAGIPAFVVADTGRPPESELPENVTWFERGDDQPIEIEREGKVVATVQLVTATAPREGIEADGEPTRDLPHPVSVVDSSPFAVAVWRPLVDGKHAASDLPQLPSKMQPIHYWALADERPRQTQRVGQALVHAPGGCQGISRREPGVLGGTLVQLNSAGQIATTFLPAAPVRWEELELSVTPATTRDGLLAEMRAAVEKLERVPTEQVWLLSWAVWGTGPLFEQLHSEEFQQALGEELVYLVELAGVTPWTHRWRLRDAQSWTESSVGSNRLEGEFVRHLLQWRQQHPDALEACLQAIEPSTAAWQTHLQALLPELDTVEILQAARRRGEAWLSEQKLDAHKEVA